MNRHPHSRYLRELALAILLGEHRRRPDRGNVEHLPRVAYGEEGVITWVTLVAILFFLILAALLANVGHVTNQKIETQNAADSVAYSGTVWNARGMNAITATNHAMGELLALYVLHHALGGEWLDVHHDDGARNSTWEMDLANFGLNQFYAVKFAPVPAQQNHYDTVKENPVADERSMLFDAKLQLKYAMNGAYLLHEVGFVIFGIPFCQAIGMGIMYVALFTEFVIWKEYLILNGIEMLARRTTPIKAKIPGVMGALKSYAETVPPAVKWGSPLVAKEVGRLNNTSAVYTFKDLPVTAEDDRVPAARCQLMRAHYPWTHYWRADIYDFLRHPILGAPISGAAGHYMKWTNVYSNEIVQWMITKKGRSAPTAPRDPQGKKQRGLGYRLLVVKGNRVPNIEKSQEAWVNDSGEAEELFCTFAFARQHRKPRVLAPKFFDEPHPKGVVCYAQAMLYNGNYQQDPAGTPGGGQTQPRVGWDTLNWKLPAHGHHSGVVEFLSTNTNPQRPDIHLNWQAKLVPVTMDMFNEAAATSLWMDPTTLSALNPDGLTGLFDAVIGNNLHQLNTH